MKDILKIFGKEHKHPDWLFGRDGALFSAASKGNTELLLELIDDGADVNVVSYTGFTPLHRACQHGNTEVVEQLIKNGADASIKTRENETALSLAESNGHSDIVSILSNLT